MFSSFVSAQDDPYVGTFLSRETGLQVQVRKTSDGYEGSLSAEGRSYPFTGFKFLGMLSGSYDYNGQTVTFSLARMLGAYMVTSDGISIPVERTSSQPPAAAAAPRPAQQPAQPSQPAQPIQSAAAPKATGARHQDPYGGYAFNAPAGWQAVQQNGGFTLSKSGLSYQLGVSPHNYRSVAAAQADVQDLRDEASGTYLRARTQPYGSNGLYVRFDGTAEGQQIVIESIALVSPHEGGVTFAAAGLAAGYPAQAAELLRSMAASAVFMQPQVSAAAQQWKQRLSGKQLLYLNTSNGLSDKTAIDLCSDGTFGYYSNSSYLSSNASNSFSYAGQDQDGGTWRIISRGASAVLVLMFSGQGSISEYELSARQAPNEAGLNGRRYFIQASERCR